MAGKPMSRYCHRPVCRRRRLSSVTFVDCGQTAIDRLMISSLSDSANIWLRQALNSIEIGLAVFEQWRLQWGYPPFCVDRDRLIGHIFGSIARRKRRTAKIMAPYYRQLFTADPMVLLTPLSADDLQGGVSIHITSIRTFHLDKRQSNITDYAILELHCKKYATFS